MGQNLAIQTGYVRGAGRVCSDGVESAGEQASEYDLASILEYQRGRDIPVSVFPQVLSCTLRAEISAGPELDSIAACFWFCLSASPVIPFSEPRPQPSFRPG